jgi:archaellum component FlaC
MNAEIIGLISLVLTSGIVNAILYRKVDKRTKTAEAFEKEVTALQGAMAGMEKSLKFTDERLERLQSECEDVAKCPVIIQKTKNDEIYLKELENETSNHS